MYKTIYRTVWRQQEVEFKDMDWDAFVNDTFNYLCGFGGQGFIETDKEFVLKSEAEKYVKGHPILIKRFPDYFLIQWLELNKTAFDEDGEEVSCDLVNVSELDLSNVPIVSNFDPVSVLNKGEN